MYTALLFLHFIGLALGVGTGFANMTLGLAMKNLAPEERMSFAMKTFALGKNGSIGLVLLIVSGVGLMLSRGVRATFEWGGGAFHAKLTLVVLMIGALGYMQMLVARAKREGGGPAMAKIPKVGRVMLVLGVGIVLSAVIAFK
jgi:uncharacterized membrane protein